MVFIVFSIVVFLLLPKGFCNPDVKDHESSLDTKLEAIDDYFIAKEQNLFTGFPALNDDGTVNIVVEIPAGTIEKWEVDSSDGSLRRKTRGGRPRRVKYLPYPGNYGMIPRTLMSREHGGDGDPLDVLVLGPSVLRGSILKGKVIGILRFLDNGEQDDKLLAVSEDSPLYEVEDSQELERKFAGAISIVTIWFSNYKGVGKMEFQGVGSVEEATGILKKAMEWFKE